MKQSIDWNGVGRINMILTGFTLPGVIMLKHICIVLFHTRGSTLGEALKYINRVSFGGTTSCLG